ncbi:putative ribonuclease H-like domain-containing protein, partial [Tanacetum coccineum]
MDLCGPMRVESINGKQYVLVIVDDYSRYTWVYFLKSKDETPEVIKTFLKKIQVLLQAPVIIVRTNNDTEFKNQVLKEYFDDVGISPQTASVKTPQQNGVVERNQTLVEAARTMLIFSCAMLFLWAEAIATTCYQTFHILNDLIKHHMSLLTAENQISPFYIPKIPYSQRLRKEKMEAQYGKFLDMIRAVQINVPLVDVLAGMPNYRKFLKELISNKHKIEQISAAFLSDESSAMIQNKVPPKLGDLGSFLIPCNFKTFSFNALADL